MSCDEGHETSDSLAMRCHAMSWGNLRQRDSRRGIIQARVPAEGSVRGRGDERHPSTGTRTRAILVIMDQSCPQTKDKLGFESIMTPRHHGQHISWQWVGAQHIRDKLHTAQSIDQHNLMVVGGSKASFYTKDPVSFVPSQGCPESTASTMGLGAA